MPYWPALCILFVCWCRPVLNKSWYCQQDLYPISKYGMLCKHTHIYIYSIYIYEPNRHKVKQSYGPISNSGCRTANTNSSQLHTTLIAQVSTSQTHPFLLVILLQNCQLKTVGWLSTPRTVWTSTSYSPPPYRTSPGVFHAPGYLVCWVYNFVPGLASLLRA